MPTTRSQKQAMISATPHSHTLPSKLRTGAGRINKPGRPTRKQYLDYDPQANTRRQRLAPKLRVMFVRFLLDRLESQGIAVEELRRTQLRDHIAAMTHNFLDIAANLERDERDVDDLADVFGQIVAPSGADVVDMMDLLDSTSLGGEGAMRKEHDVDLEDISASSGSTADGHDLSESEFSDTMLAANETEWGVDEDDDEYDTDSDDDGEDDAEHETDEDDLAATHPLPADENQEDDGYDDDDIE